MERLRDTLLLGALASASPALAEETQIAESANVEESPQTDFDRLMLNAKPVSEMTKADIKGDVYAFFWSNPKDESNMDLLEGPNVGFKFDGGKLYFFFKAKGTQLVGQGENAHILFETNNDEGDRCYRATKFVKTNLSNPVDGVKEATVLVYKSQELTSHVVGEKGCEAVISETDNKVKKTLNADLLLPDTASVSVAANAGTVYPYVDPIKNEFAPFAYSGRNGVSAELRVDWKPLGDNVPLSVGPEATLVVGADGTGTAGRVGGHLGLEVDRVKVAVGGGKKFDSYYGALDEVPYVGLDIRARIVNLGETVSLDGYVQANKDFVGNDVLDPNVAIGVSAALKIPDIKPATIAKVQKPEKPKYELKAAAATEPVEAHVVADAVEPAKTADKKPEKVKDELVIEELPFGGVSILDFKRDSAVEVMSVEGAEYTRLSEEMRKFAARNAWPAVERNFNALKELQKKKKTGLTYKDLQLGAEAARALGDIQSAYSRVRTALSLSPDDKAMIDWSEEVNKKYGEVVVKITKKSVFAAVIPPFAPDDRAALAFATSKLAETGEFSGYLPVGKYTVNGQEFEVVSLETQKVIHVSID